MINNQLDSGKVLSVWSQYDSGTHKGFDVGVLENGEYRYKTLDKILTKEEIVALEMLLSTTITKMIESKEQHK